MLEIKERGRDEYEKALELALRVFLEFNEADYSSLGVDEYRKTIGERDYLDKLRVYTAYVDGHEAGVLATRNGGSHIGQFYVDGHYQRKGIGKALFDRAWKDNNKGYMTVNASSFAVPVYRALGFNAIGQIQESNGLKFTPMEKIELYYEESGEGKPLIMLHGNGEDGTYFAQQVKFFSGKYRTITIDTRGHGRSPRGAAPFTIRQFARDLAGFMKTEDIDKAHILGFSDGGNIALIFAMEYPQYVDRLIIDGANLFPGAMKSAVYLGVRLAYGFYSLFGPWSKKELFGLMVNDPYIKAEELAAIKAHTLVISGTKDMIRPEHTKLIAGSIPGARDVTISGSHFIARDNPTGFNRAIEEFLKDDDHE